MRSHMARYARCGCGVSRSSGLLSSLALHLMPLRWILALAVGIALTTYVSAQDVNVHIEPRSTADPTAKDKDKDKAATDKNAIPDLKPSDLTDDPGLKINRKNRITSEVDLVLVSVTVTDDWNRIVTGL